MAEQLILPQGLARNLADIDYDLPRTTFVDSFAEMLAPFDIVAVVENRHTGEETRWSSIHELILQTKDGRLWRRLYSVGLTERQGEAPFEYDGPEVPFDECKRKTVEAVEYVPMDSPEVKVEIKLSDTEKVEAFRIWVRQHSDEFEAWVRRYNRIHGGM